MISDSQQEMKNDEVRVSREQMDNKENKGWMGMTEKKGKEGEKYMKEWKWQK